jgi:UTP--glucose-1-phosphate uridylyltransferase
MSCLDLDLRGDRAVRKVVIPVAGLGTRMFPASKVMKKELFPVVTPDGVAKPIIVPIIEEAISSGVEQICLVVRKSGEPFLDKFFHEPVPIEHFNKLPQPLREYERSLRDIGTKITLIPQESPEGFGHAVYCAREWVGDEPFLLMLGDHLCVSDTALTCAQQLLEVHKRVRTNLVAVRRVPEALVENFGTLTGRWLDEEHTLLEVEEFAEKPTRDYASSNLRVPGLPEGEYLCLFGQYVLNPDVFRVLGEHISANLRERGEFQLTSALERLRRETGFRAYLVQGHCYDTGMPLAYLDALNAFRKGNG